MDKIDSYIESVRIAYSKTGGNNWPARGRQLMSSYIRFAALNQFSLLKKLREKCSRKQIADLFWSTTQIRYLITGEFVVGLKINERDYRSPSLQEVTEATEFLLSLLEEKAVSDSFCLNGSNKVLNEEEVKKIMSLDSWGNIDLTKAKILAASLASFSWAFGFDTHFSNFMNIDGPYKVNDSKQLLVREYNFSEIKSVWENAPVVPNMIRVYLLFNNSDISIDWELHSESSLKFDLINARAVKVIDGVESEINSDEADLLISLTSSETIKQVKYVDELSVLDKVRKGALLSFLQTKSLSDFLGLDWKPTKEVETAIIEKGEDYWFGRNLAPRKPSVNLDNWLSVFDPRVPKE